MIENRKKSLRRKLLRLTSAAQRKSTCGFQRICPGQDKKRGEEKKVRKWKAPAPAKLTAHKSRGREYFPDTLERTTTTLEKPHEDSRFFTLPATRTTSQSRPPLQSWKSMRREKFTTKPRICVLVRAPFCAQTLRVRAVSSPHRAALIGSPPGLVLLSDLFSPLAYVSQMNGPCGLINHGWRGEGRDGGALSE